MAIDKNTLIKHTYALEKILYGYTWASVAEEYEVTISHVRDRAIRLFRMMINPIRLNEPFPYHDFCEINMARANKDFWIRQLARLRRELYESKLSKI